MAESESSTPTDTGTLFRPLSQMSFIVTLTSSSSSTASSTTSVTAAFSEVTGVESTVDVIEFRQGNSASLAPIKVPGLVKHGNITLRFGYTEESDFKDWVIACVGEQRPALDRNDLTIELIDTVAAKVDSTVLSSTTSDSEKRSWILKNAWVCKYSGVDFNASTSAIAMESVEVAYESLIIPNKANKTST